MINTLLAKIGMGIVATATIVAGWLGVDTQQLGSTVPLTPALFETSLSSPIGVSDVSMTLAKGTLIDGSTLSGYTCFTVDSGQPNIEYICGTANGTAVTALIRGVNPLNGTSSVSSLIYSHRRGANVKVTDYPAISIQGRIINGIDGFPNVLHYDSHPCSPASGSTSICDKSYSDALVNQGAATATDLVSGIAKLSVAAVSSVNPIVVGDNDTRVPTQGENDALVGSTGTPSTLNPYLTKQDVATTSRSNAIVRASSTGFIDSTFIQNTSSSSLLSRIYYVASITSTTTLASITVPANSMTANGVIKITIPTTIVPTVTAGNASFYIVFGDTSTSTLILPCSAIGGGNAVTGVGMISANIMNISSTTAQRVVVLSSLSPIAIATNPIFVNNNIVEATTTVNTTIDRTLKVYGYSAGCTTATYSGTIELIK